MADPTQAEAGNWLPLDQSDGFPANGMNSGSVFVDADGSLWWGADNDLAHYIPPPDLVSPQVSPQVFVSAFSWDNHAPRLAEAVDGLPHGANGTAHIGSLQFDRRGALRLRYRVLPGQSSWRETKVLDLVLGNLASGRHTLEVQGRVFTGPWSAPVRRSFTVLRPVWLAWPFLAAYFLASGSLVAGGYWLRRLRKDEHSRVLPDLSSWRLDALVPEVSELAGTLLDARFEAGALIARGGFASVMAGRDHVEMRPCAIKIFRTEVSDKAWIHRSFDDEVAALQKVRHPNVVSIFAHGHTPSGAPYLVWSSSKARTSARSSMAARWLPAARRVCSANLPARSTPFTPSVSAIATSSRRT